METKKVIVRFRVNPKRAKVFKKCGVPEQERDEKKIIQKHKKQAERQGDNPFHYNRKDGAGNKRPDSGISVFEEQGWDPKFVDLSKIHDNLLVCGFHLNSASLLQKEGDRMFFLYLVYEKKKADSLKNLFLKKEEFLEQMKNIYAEVYQFLYVYKNEDGTVTLNPSHIVPEKPAESIVEMDNTGVNGGLTVKLCKIVASVS